ncbi:MAG: substrate-binding domain-containing protein [Gammaproteobacteria bacterium]|nr:substrate-binding domain-containing protein [Gammaproteobacteria bacterium]
MTSIRTLTHSGFVSAFFILFSILTNHSNAAEQHQHQHQHGHDGAFSDPGILAPVNQDWNDTTLNYDEKYRDSDLVVALGQQTHPLFKQLIADYAKQNNIKITLLHGTCGITSGRLRKKQVDVGAFCCPPGVNDRFPGMKFHSLGISPIALIVHPSNPLKNLSRQQAREIFQGKVSKWSAVDGAAPALSSYIKPVGRLHCKIRPGHWRLLLSNENEFSPRLFEVGVIADMISQVARNKNAIGWEVPLMVEVYKDKGEVRMLKIDGHSADDLEYLLSGHYPLYRSYSLTTWENKDHKQSANKLVSYLQAHIEKVHAEVNYIPPSRLRKAGWKFIGDELVGEPDKSF